jgi:hypothetical protein
MVHVPASIRDKNPGAMWGHNPVAAKWGAIGTEELHDGLGQGNNAAIFPTYVAGICAQIDLWRSRRYRNRRFEDAIAEWSGGNNVGSYVHFVLTRVPEMTRDTRINDAFLNSPTGIKFLKAQAWHEAGEPYPAPDADWLEAQRVVFSSTPVHKKVTSAAATGIAAGAAAHAAALPGWAVALIAVAAAAAVLFIWGRAQK